MTTHVPQAKKPGPNLWLSIFIFIAGAVLASAGATLLAGSFLGVVTEDAFEIPGGETRDFDAGTFDIYVSASDRTFPTDTLDANVEDITITNVDSGATLDVNALNPDVPVTRGQSTFLRLASFDVVEAGTYQIAIVSEVG